MKAVIILIGLKGSGKSYIGSLMQQKLGIEFLCVEKIWLSLKSERFTKDYIEEGYRLVELEIEKLLQNTERIIIESTGTTDHFNRFIKKLGNEYNVKLIKINTSPETCIKRVKSRDASAHVPVSDDIVKQINNEAAKVKLNYDLVIDNEHLSDSEILERIRTILQ